MSKNELVTVVVPTYNRAHLIGRTINSVLNQTYSNFELIIIDDASTDNTENVVNNFRDDRIRYIKLENNSQGTKPRNIGIENASGKFIAFLDSDDEWVNDKLEKQLKFLDQFNSEDIVCFTGLKLRDGSSEILSDNRQIKNDEDIMDYILLHDNWVQTSTYMISSQLAKRTMFGKNVKKHQDWDFCLRLRNNGAKFVYFPEYLTIYYVDKRDDRIGSSLKYQLSLEWAKAVRGMISDRAYYAFLSKIVAIQLVLNAKKIEPFKIYCIAYFKRSIRFWPFAKGIAKCIMPWYYIRKLKA